MLDPLHQDSRTLQDKDLELGEGSLPSREALLDTREQQTKKLLSLLQLGSDQEATIIGPLLETFATFEFYTLDEEGNPENFAETPKNCSFHNDEPYLPVFVSLEEAQQFVREAGLTTQTVVISGAELAAFAIDNEPPLGIEIVNQSQSFLVRNHALCMAASFMTYADAESELYTNQAIAVFSGEVPRNLKHQVELALIKFSGIDAIYIGGKAEDPDQPLILMIGDISLQKVDVDAVLFHVCNASGLNTERRNIVWISNTEIRSEFDRLELPIIFERK